MVPMRWVGTSQALVCRSAFGAASLRHPAGVNLSIEGNCNDDGFYLADDCGPGQLEDLSEVTTMYPSATLVGSCIVIVVLVLVSLGGLMFVRRILKLEELESHHPVTDPLLQVVGMMFAILLGFMVGDAMSRFTQARMIVQQEASSIADVFRLAGGFSNPERDNIRSLCSRYADDVINDEWPKLAAKKTSNKVWKTYNELWATLNGIKVKDDSEACVLQCILPCMVSVGDNRRMRVEAMHNGLPAALWGVLGMAGVATIMFTFLFAAPNRILQMVMTSIITIVMGLNVFMLASYDDPFSGDVMVSPDAFVVDQKTFKMATDKADPYESDDSK